MFEISISIFLVFIVFIIVRGFMKNSKEAKEYHQHLEEGLKDEYITDPETGAKYTLEEVEAEQWVKLEPELISTAKTDINKLFNEEEIETEKALNHFRDNPQYRKVMLTEDQIKILGLTKILSKYKEWTYFSPFQIEYCSGILFFPTITVSSGPRSFSYMTQCMVWIKLDKSYGHYYLREKTTTERLLDLIREDDEIKLTNYESFTINKTESSSQLNKIIEKLEGIEGLEIELIENNLFIKNTMQIDINEVTKIEKIIKNVSLSCK
ncbi:hypothetical protein [Sporocytophaga myxococcoides]|uniref:hypothetical protein n=1 Tax=Sporocytophaga myxococcoides TaxID=153721 RepID=UPI00042A040F|nr:hypothetical protein [Sporocytophaga myxococcoides]